MSFHSKPFLTAKKATKLRKKLYHYSTTDANGNPISSYIKADNPTIAESIIRSNHPGCGEIKITEFKPKR